MSAAADLSAICQRCGLCCNGSLYLAARLEREEVAPMRRRGLTILQDDDGFAFELPCPQLEQASSSCSIYEARPRTCRRFQCSLLERARAGAMPVEVAIETVARTKELIRALQASGMDMSPGADRALSGDEPEIVLGLLSEVMVRLGTDFARGSELE